MQLLLSHLIILILYFSRADGLSNHFELRRQLIHDEEILYFGGKIQLNEHEAAANKVLMAAKLAEIDEARKNTSKFLPSQNFLDVRPEIEKTKVFQMIRKMPKGAVLHAHSKAIGSFDFIIRNITYMPNLYICLEGGRLKFEFCEKPRKDCDWQLLEEVRSRDKFIDETIRKHVILKSEATDNVETMWNKYMTIHNAFKGILKYRPAFEVYLYEALKDLHDDNVMYIELRSAISQLYELDGTVLQIADVVKIYKDVSERFKAAYPNFIGVKLIYAPNRHLNNKRNCESYIENYRTAKERYPDVIIGFDLVGQEDKGVALTDVVDKLIELNDEMPFFFHAGETNWYGDATDENLFDAVILNTQRIGHGFALPKHPKLLQLIKEKSIAIELNPISNQFFELVQDLRNHPISALFTQDYPIVVSSDDPSFWGANGLSYDFYETFVGIMSRKADLRALKKLAINSIVYSKMSDDERIKAYRIWYSDWDKFVKDLAVTNVLLDT